MIGGVTSGDAIHGEIVSYLCHNLDRGHGGRIYLADDHDGGGSGGGDDGALWDLGDRRANEELCGEVVRTEGRQSAPGLR